jgi:hypothetical protein
MTEERAADCLYVVDDCLDKIQQKTAEQVKEKEEHNRQWHRDAQVHAFSTADEAKKWMVDRAAQDLDAMKELTVNAMKRLKKCIAYEVKK